MFTIKKFMSETSIYAIGSIFARGINFLLLPIYTRLFTPELYGQIEFVIVICLLVSEVLMMGLDSSLSFYFHEKNQKTKAARSILISSILQFRLFFGLIFLILISFSTAFLTKLIIGERFNENILVIAFSSVLITQIMVQSSEVLRLLFRPWPYIFITIAHSILTALFIISLIVILDYGIEGYFYGLLLGSIFASILGWFIIREYINFTKIHFSYWIKLIKFGLPLVPAGMAFYALNLGDRWFVKYLTNDYELGIFAVGAKISLIITVLMETLRKAWWPHILDNLDKTTGVHLINFLSKLLMTIGLCTLIAFFWLSPYLVGFFTSPLYHKSWTVASLLGFASFFNSLFLIASIGIWKEKKTYLNVYLLTISFILGCFLNVVFIPKFGINGAAFATLITCIFWIFITYHISEKFYKTNLPLKNFLLQILVCTFYLTWIINWLDSLVSFLIAPFCIILIFLCTYSFKDLFKKLK